MLSPENPVDIKSIEKCRNITKEILNFGVSQKEILKIIENLSMELENTEIMKEICNTINLNHEVNQKEKLIL